MINEEYQSVPGDVDAQEASDRKLCLNCYGEPRVGGEEFGRECIEMFEEDEDEG